MILEVVIKDPVAGTSQTLRFAKSPIRIGRNQLNDMPLEDPFVSEWHGVIRFDEQGVAYFDMGSTNGTILDGKRLPKNVPSTLTTQSRLLLGRREVTVSPPVQSPGTSTAAAASGIPNRLTTMGWGQPLPSMGGSGPRHPAPPAIEGDARAAAPAGLAWPHLPTGHSGGGVMGPDGPSWPHAEPARAEARSDGRGDARAEGHADDARSKVLAAFCEAFVGLRKGYEQFGAEVGVRTVNGSTPLHRARTSQDVVAHLTDPKVDPHGAAEDLIAIFADFGIHHIAMMEGITEGVRALLQSLDPRAFDLEVGGRLFSAAKAKAQWKTYLDHFDQLVTDDEQLHSAIFGDEFARAYASVTLGHGGDKDDKDDNDDKDDRGRG